MSTSEGQQDGPEIRRLREKLGMSVDDLACKVGIHAQSVRRIEAGRRGAKLDMLLKIAEALDVRLLYIVKRGTPLHAALTRGDAPERVS